MQEGRQDHAHVALVHQQLLGNFYTIDTMTPRQQTMFLKA